MADRRKLTRKEELGLPTIFSRELVRSDNAVRRKRISELFRKPVPNAPAPRASVANPADGLIRWGDCEHFGPSATSLVDDKIIDSVLVKLPLCSSSARTPSPAYILQATHPIATDICRTSHRFQRCSGTLYWPGDALGPLARHDGQPRLSPVPPIRHRPIRHRARPDENDRRHQRETNQNQDPQPLASKSRLMSE